jgi:hypothetical protein
MTHATSPANQFSEGDFRVGHVFSLAWSVFSGNYVKFAIMAGISFLPLLLVQQTLNPANLVAKTSLAVIAGLLAIVLFLCCQAVLLHAAFQYMSGKPANLAESIKVGLRRFFPIIGIGLIAFAVALVYLLGVGAIVAALGRSLLSPGFIVLVALIGIIPGVMLVLMWLVAVPACVVERLGPIRSLARSQILTKGHRWKLFGLQLLLLVIALVVGIIVGIVLGLGTAAVTVGVGAAVAATLNLILNLVWNASWTAYQMIVLVVAYHDLRVAKEGVSTDQIAAVFE